MGISAQKANKFILFVFKHSRELGLVLHQFCFPYSINFLKIRKKYGGIWELQNYVPRGAEHQDCVHFPRNMTQCGCLDNAWTFFRKVVSIHWTAVSTHTHHPPPSPLGEKIFWGTYSPTYTASASQNITVLKINRFFVFSGCIAVRHFTFFSVFKNSFFFPLAYISVYTEQKYRKIK